MPLPVTEVHEDDRPKVTLLEEKRKVVAVRHRLSYPVHEDFPDDLAHLSLADLQILHSRVCWQLDQEYLHARSGPAPETLDRHHAVTTEMTRRQRSGHTSTEQQSEKEVVP